MCTVVILRRPDHVWPLLLAANRDEMKSRPWLAPGRHWPDRPEVVAGLDLESGGSWLGINDHGVVAGVLNRVGSLGPQPGKRSRGELVLEALDHADADAAAAALTHIDPNAYRTFNLVVADNRDAIWLRNRGIDGPGWIEAEELPAGLSLITARERNDPTSPRIRTYLERFADAPAPDPETGDWQAWRDLLACRLYDPVDGPTGAMTVVTATGFETLSSSLIALPALPRSLDAAPVPPVWLFASGRPDQADFEPVRF